MIFLYPPERESINLQTNSNYKNNQHRDTLNIVYFSLFNILNIFLLKLYIYSVQFGILFVLAPVQSVACTMQHCTVQYCTVGTRQYSTLYSVLYCTANICHVMFCSVQYCTVQYYTATFIIFSHGKCFEGFPTTDLVSNSFTVLYCTTLFVSVLTLH